VFEDLRQALRDLLSGGVPPNERHATIAHMRDTLVQARVGLDDLRRSCDTTRLRLAEERQELATAERRRTLAEQIQDAETAELAQRYAARHAERVAVLERKLESQEAEIGLVDAELTEMTAQLKQAIAGVGSGLRSTADADPLGESADEALRAQLDGLRLAELKRRMGK
jgi:chromosome segregation ATPase